MKNDEYRNPLPKHHRWLIVALLVLSALFIGILCFTFSYIDVYRTILALIISMIGSLLIATIAYFGIYRAHSSQIENLRRDEQLELVKSINTITLAAHELVMNLYYIKKNYRYQLERDESDAGLATIPNIPVSTSNLTKTSLSSLSIGSKVKVEKGPNSDNSDTSLVTILSFNEIWTHNLLERWKHRNQLFDDYYSLVLRVGKLTHSQNLQVDSLTFSEELDTKRVELINLTKFLVIGTEKLMDRNLDLLKNCIDKLPLLVSDEYRNRIVDARISESLKTAMRIKFYDKNEHDSEQPSYSLTSED